MSIVDKAVERAMKGAAPAGEPFWRDDAKDIARIAATHAAKLAREECAVIAEEREKGHRILMHVEPGYEIAAAAAKDIAAAVRGQE